MDPTNVNVGKAVIFAQLLETSPHHITSIHATNPKELTVASRTFQVNSVFPSTTTNEQCASAISKEVSEWLWSGFNASVICHGTDASYSSAVQQFSDIITATLFKPGACTHKRKETEAEEKAQATNSNTDSTDNASNHAHVRVGVSAWELDSVGRKCDILRG